VARHNYSATGYLHQVLDTNNRLLWQVAAMDAHRRIVQESFGAGLVTEHSYNPANIDLAKLKGQDRVICSKGCVAGGFVSSNCKLHCGRGDIWSTW
jgi:hypothetical protein